MPKTCGISSLFFKKHLHFSRQSNFSTLFEIQDRQAIPFHWPISWPVLRFPGVIIIKKHSRMPDETSALCL